MHRPILSTFEIALKSENHFIMKNLFSFLLIGLMLSACGGSEFKKNPVDELIKTMDNKEDFTIILYDMDVEGTFFEEFKHRYKIVSPTATSTPEETITDWVVVKERFFNEHVNDMGMEIASKKDGKIEKNVAPPGYSNYVGNERYGEWRTDNSGRSFWEFYGQYAFMRSMLGLVAGPVYRTGYYDYRDNYTRYGRPYYGNITSTGTPQYGTSSTTITKQNPSFASRVSNSSSFRNKVGTRVARSTGSSTVAGQRSTGSSSSSTSKTSRSSSRYGSSGSSSSRSRSSSRGGK